MTHNIDIILASGSPRRRELMSQAGYNYTVITSDVDEDTDSTIPKDYVMDLSHRKASDIFCKELVKRTKTSSDEPGDSLDSPKPFLVLGADTVVALNGRILGKPADRDDAFNTLHSLSGQTHHVYTGVSLVYYDGKNTHNSTFYECTEVSFYDMTPEEISAYIATDEPMDKAGSYGIQGKGGVFVKEIKGDYNNVVGLPLSRVYHEINAILKSL